MSVEERNEYVAKYEIFIESRVKMWPITVLGTVKMRVFKGALRPSNDN
jgi:hypothetical protein